MIWDAIAIGFGMLLGHFAYEWGKVTLQKFKKDNDLN